MIYIPIAMVNEDVQCLLMYNVWPEPVACESCFRHSLKVLLHSLLFSDQHFSTS